MEASQVRYCITYLISLFTLQVCYKYELRVTEFDMLKLALVVWLSSSRLDNDNDNDLVMTQKLWLTLKVDKKDTNHSYNCLF